MPVKIVSKENYVDAVINIKPEYTISIKDKSCEYGDKVYHRGTIDHLSLYFDDVETITHPNSPILTDIEKARDFINNIEYYIDKNNNIESTLLLHCTAGISRSPAISLLYLNKSFNLKQDKYNEDRISYITNKLYNIKPQAYPNSLIVSLIDIVLELEGNLEKEIIRIKKSQEGKLIL